MSKCQPKTKPRKSASKIKADVKRIINDCEWLGYLKGDDFGAYPIKKVNKKRAISLITDYIVGGQYK